MKYFRNRIAQYEDETDYVDTYGALLTRCVRVAMKLQELDIGEDDIVGACTHNHRNSCVPFIASTFIGAIPVTFDPAISDIDTVSLLRLMQPKVIFISQEMLKDFETYMEKAQVKPAYTIVFGESRGQYMSFDEFLKPNIKERQFKVYETSNPKKTAVVVFSSGTTGLPKGICLNHYTLLKQSGSFRDDWPEIINSDTVDSVILLYSTLYAISAVGTLIGAVLKGEAKVLCKSFNAKRFFEIVEKYKVTMSFVPPYYIHEVVVGRAENKDVDIGSLKLLVTGSTTVSTNQMVDMMAAFPGSYVVNVYGQTEVSGAISCLYDPKDHDLQRKKPTTVGKIISHYQWKIVDLETEKPVTGPNKKGELRLKTDLHMNGYYKMDSSDAFDSEGYLRTGDVAYVDEDNCLYIDDRIKEMFKYRGWHVLPAIVEEVVMAYPAVKEAAAIGIPHSEDGEHAMALVVLKEGHENVSPEDIKKYADERLGEYQKLRAGVKIVDELIRTATGKVKRKAMKEMILSNGTIRAT
ncbi:unnamed protein product [Acanthoscelides obtectus]|nr:unnamed protein product [Acanthoscelides obtectus]CAK1662879.1 hypothetical protein AOBTE_LOCUS23360 [Acanthoscelides obtectus]